jgi:hypothetical protein
MASRMGIAEVILTLEALYGEKFAAPTTFGLDKWEEWLEDVEDAEMAVVVKRWDGEWPPTPVDIRRLAHEARRTFADLSHHEYPSATAGELEMTYPDPVEKMRQIREAYDARFRPDLRVVGDD